MLGGTPIPAWFDLSGLRMGQSYRREVCEIWANVQKEAKRKKVRFKVSKMIPSHCKDTFEAPRTV